MSRFELTLSDGERILINRDGGGMQELLSDLVSSNFLLLSEIRGPTAAAPEEIIVATGQITLIRAIDRDSRQNSTFRPKR